jgi:signal transduction histidine kinase/ABC-type branched-subunit amino acid transport system ATPase component
MKYQVEDNYAADYPLFKLQNISLYTDSNKILNKINLQIYPSEVHALVGEHGTGKSSVGLIFSGVLKPTSGQIIINNKSYNSLNLRKARKLNIEMVYQQIYLIDYFTVAENLLIPDKVVNAFPFVNKKQLINEAEILLRKYGFNIDPLRIVKDLKLSEKMTVYILRSIYRQPELLILDEALAKLTKHDFDRIIELLNQLKNDGMSMLCITNRIDDIYNFADKVTIIKNGEILLTDSVNNIDRINLIKMCYSQLTEGDNSGKINREFYHLLKYNEAILQKLPVNLIVTDNENKIRMVNEYGKRYFNLGNTNYINLLLDDIFLKENIEPLALIKNALLEEKEKAFYNIPLNIKQKETITNIKTFPIFDGMFIIGNIIIIEDVSEQERMRQQIMLSDKLASVGLLSAGVAHEINNPLEIIYNYINYLRFHLNKKSLHETIDNLEEEITCIKQIVSNLISFSDSNKRIDEEFDLNDLIKNILNLIKYNAKDKNINISFSESKNCLKLKANKNEIKQVLLNLLKNSFEEMSGGGSIFIATGTTTVDNSKLINIIIEDTGRGINDNNPNNIFLPFYSTKKGRGNNLGLGLSVSYGIIKKYNGDISVTNLKSSGCEFTISLPCEIN